MYVFPTDGVALCTGVYGFRTWHCLDFAFYVMTGNIHEFADISSVGSFQGLQALVEGPKANNHEINPDNSVTVENAVFVGTPFKDYCSLYTIDSSNLNYKLSRMGEGMKMGTYGKVINFTNCCIS